MTSNERFRRVNAATFPKTPLELISEQREIDRWTLPTSAQLFRRGDCVDAIYVVAQGLVELDGGPGSRVRYGIGELFFTRI